MRVTLIGYTEMTETAWDHLDETEFFNRAAEDDGVDSDILPEYAGRICYDSYDLPRQSTRSNEDYLENIRMQQHFSVLEHSQFSFHVAEVSRAMLAELTRHRHLSFSVRSQRFCDESQSRFVVPAALQGYEELTDQYLALQKAARDLYAEMLAQFEESGVPHKIANDAARYALPEGTHTELVVSGNARAWLEFLLKRKNPHAAQEIQDFATAVSLLLKECSPHIFRDA